jgi:hypothetical protein
MLTTLQVAKGLAMADNLLLARTSLQ